MNSKDGRSPVVCLVLTDLHMPSLDGSELAHAIHAQSHPDTRSPVIAFTTTALASMAQRIHMAHMARMAGLHSKPATLGDLG